jgi:hypothetical protein
MREEKKKEAESEHVWLRSQTRRELRSVPGRSETDAVLADVVDDVDVLWM